MNDRDCDNCAHHSEGGCSVWECSFEQKDDTISRQAAIGALCGECQANCIPCESFPCGEIKAVQALPSAQPEPSWDCEKCMMEHTDEMEKLEAELAIAKSKQPEPCEDAVSRQAAIDFIDAGRLCNPNEPRWSDNEVVNFLKTRPSAQAEQKWIPCSERSPKKYGWYQVTLKDGRVNRLYYDYKSDRWIDNVRKHMFELYDIYSKSTHKRITEEKEDVYWDDWVIAWMPLPEPYRAERRTDE